MLSFITSVLKSNMDMAWACFEVISGTAIPRIRSLIAIFAALSISLIQVSLHGLHTTFAFMSNSGMLHRLLTEPSKSTFEKCTSFSSDGKRSFIQSLQRCSPDIFAREGQNAHLSGICFVMY